MTVYQGSNHQQRKAGAHRKITRWEIIRDWCRAVLFEGHLR